MHLKTAMCCYVTPRGALLLKGASENKTSSFYHEEGSTVSPGLTFITETKSNLDIVPSRSQFTHLKVPVKNRTCITLYESVLQSVSLN